MMVEDDQYCVDILTQLSAIMAPSRSVDLAMPDSYIRGCVLGTCPHGYQDQEELLAELSTAIEHLVKSAG